MKILHLCEFYNPSKGGMQEVVKQLSENMAKSGNQVVVGTTYLANRTDRHLNGVSIVDFHVSGNEVNGYQADKNEITRFQTFVTESDFDIVVLFAAQQWTCDLILPLLYKIKGKKIFVPTGFSALSNPAYKNYYEEMKKKVNEFNTCVFLSSNYQDINFAKASGLKNYITIPNGASKEEFNNIPSNNIKERLGIKNEDYFILHVGSHTNTKGHDEAISIFLKSKIKNGVLVINGNTFSKRCHWKCLLKSKLINAFSRKKIILVDLPRTDVLSLYKEADLFLFPSHIECSPIVLFEACASRTPFLASEAGNNKEIADWTKGGLILPTSKIKGMRTIVDINKSVNLLNQVYEDKNLSKKLSEEGYQSWLLHFTWEKIAEKYEALYRG